MIGLRKKVIGTGAILAVIVMVAVGWILITRKAPGQFSDNDPWEHYGGPARELLWHEFGKPLPNFVTSVKDVALSENDGIDQSVRFRFTPTFTESQLVSDWQRLSPSEDVPYRGKVKGRKVFKKENRYLFIDADNVGAELCTVR